MSTFSRESLVCRRCKFRKKSEKKSKKNESGESEKNESGESENNGSRPIRRRFGRG
jgi:hypothetical protein